MWGWKTRPPFAAPRLSNSRKPAPARRTHRVLIPATPAPAKPETDGFVFNLHKRVNPMKPTVQTKIPSAAPRAARRGPYLNALKHGLRSGSVLVPDDNVAEFRKLRHRLFHLHRPRTIEEAQCVETIAASLWRMARCRREGSLFKHHLGAVVSGDPDATGNLWSPDPHRIHHRATDCGLEEVRLEKSMHRARQTLEVLQKQRTQNFALEKSGVLEDVEVLLAEGEPVVEDEAPEVNAAAESLAVDAPGNRAETATGSADRRTEKFIRSNSASPPSPIPKHWSRRQREAALRQGSLGWAAGRTALWAAGAVWSGGGKARVGEFGQGAAVRLRDVERAVGRRGAGRCAQASSA